MATADSSYRVSEADPAFEPPMIRFPKIALEPGQAPEPPSPFTFGTVVQSFRRRWFLAVPLGIVLAAGFGAAAVRQVPPKYTAFSLLRISYSEPQLLPGRDGSGSRLEFSTYQRTQATLIKSKFVLAAALREPNVAALALIRDLRDPIQFLEDEIKVEFQDSSEIVRVNLSAAQPPDLPVIINAVTNAYLREIVNSERRRKVERMTELEQIYNKSEQTMRTKRNLIQDLMKTLWTGDPQALALKQQIALNIFGELKREHHRLLNEIRRQQVRRKSMEAQKKARQTQPIPQADVEELVNGDAKVQEEARLLAALGERLASLESTAVRKNEPILVRTRATHEASQKRLSELKEKVHQEIVRKGNEVEVRRIDAELAQLDEALLVLVDQEKAVREQAENGSTQTQKIGTSSSELELMQAEFKQVSTIADTVRHELERVRVELQSPPRVSLVQPAELPTQPELKRTLAITGMASLAGLVLGLGLVSLYGLPLFKAAG